MTLINGRPAMEVIEEFAREVSSKSRDLGVRFNSALCSLKYIPNEDGSIGQFYAGNEFSYRTYLPETDSIEYTLECPRGIPKPIKREWKLTASSKLVNNFQDSQSFFENNCLASPPSKEFMDPQKIMTYPQIKSELIPITLFKTNSFELNLATHVRNVGLYQFYRSYDKTIGIVVVPKVQEKDRAGILEALKELYDNGARRVSNAYFLLKYNMH